MSGSIRRIAVAATLAVAVAGDALAQCGPHLVQSGAKELDKQIKSLQQQIKEEQKQIKRMGLDKRAEDFEAWDELAGEAKKDFEKQALDSLMVNMKEAVHSNAAKQLKSLNPWNDDKLIAQLRKKGKLRPGMEDAIKRIAKVRGKPGMLRSAQSAVDTLEKAKEHADDFDEFLETVDALKSGSLGFSAEDGLEAAKDLLGEFVQDPTLKALVANLEFMTASLYNNAARRIAQSEVNRLTDMTERQLLDLQRIHCDMERNVKTLKLARAKVANTNANAKNTRTNESNSQQAAKATKSGGGGAGQAVAVAAGIGGATVAGLYAADQISKASAPDCSSYETSAYNQLNGSFTNAINNLVVCSANPRNTCSSQITAMNNSVSSILNTLGSWCTCMGPSAQTELSASDKRDIQQAFSELRSLGINPGSLPSCFR